MMQIQKSQTACSFELWTSRGSWFWQLSGPSDGRGIIGAAPSADQAACDACAALEEIEPGSGFVEIVPALLESAVTWSGALEGFRRAAVSARC